MKTLLVMAAFITAMASPFPAIAQEGATVDSNEFIPDGLESENQNLPVAEQPTVEPPMGEEPSAAVDPVAEAASDETNLLSNELGSETNAPESNTNQQNQAGLIEVEPLESLGDVSVETQSNMNLPYKERRSQHGVIFGLGVEKFYPSEYFSLIDDTFVDDMLGGDPISLMTLELGYKFNFALGSLIATYNFASGQTTGATGATSRSMQIQKHAASIGYLADNVFKEPWIVPYVQAGLHQFSVDEEDFNASGTLSEDAATTGFALNYKVGMLFQLNWIEDAIDPTTHSEGLRSSGLENTYLDLSLSWYDPSQDLFDPNNPIETAESDPDLRSEAQLGVGLKLEF